MPPDKLTQRPVPKVVTKASLILADESCDVPLALDPIEAALWELMDGSIGIQELSDDVTAVAGDLGVTPEEARRHLTCLLDRLARAGFVSGLGTDRRPPRAILAPIPRDSCLSDRLGLSRATLAILGRDGGRVQVAITHDGLAERAAQSWPGTWQTAEGPVGGTELVALRYARGHTPRVQQVLGHFAQVHFASRDANLAVGAWARTVAGLARLDANDGIWLHGPALVADGALLAVHPAFLREVTGALRCPLERAGLALSPGGLLELSVVAGRLHAGVPADWMSDDRPLTWPVASVVLPASRSELERDRILAHLLRRWDQPHLDRLPNLVELPFEAVPPSVARSDLFDALVRAARTAHR